MAFLSIPNVAIRGISACVPPKVEENRALGIYDDPSEREGDCYHWGREKTQDD